MIISCVVYKISSKEDYVVKKLARKRSSTMKKPKLQFSKSLRQKVKQNKKETQKQEEKELEDVKDVPDII